MKKTLLFLLMAASLAFGQQTKEQKINQAYKIGIEALNSGDLAKAEKYLSAVVKASPTHGNAKLGLIKVKESRSTKKNTKSKDQFADITIKKIDLVDMPFKEAVEAFGIIVDNNNGDVGPPNISIIDRQNKFANKNITINLENIPAKGVFDYILDTAGATANYGEYIIDIRPR